MSSLNSFDYQYLQDFLRESLGHALDDSKQYLAVSRLTPVAEAFGVQDVSELLSRLRMTSDFRIRDAVMDAMTIQETSFFRSDRCFETLRTRSLPALLQARQGTRHLRIWSGACSTGQEPYSVAMTLLDHFPQLAGWNVELLATDVSRVALERAERGSYHALEIQRGLPPQTLARHFQPTEGGHSVSETVRRVVQFRRFNVMEPLELLGGPFDLIFLRNVLIYMDPRVAKTIFGRLRKIIAPDGYLVLGESETVFGHTEQFAIPEGHPDHYVPV